MAITYSLIASNTLGSSAASVTFSSIPNTYTDLVVKVSTRRSTSGFVNLRMKVNGSSTTNFSYTYLLGNGSTATSSRSTTLDHFVVGFGVTPGSTETTNTFSNVEIYIPNYTSSANKVFSGFGAGETNDTAANISANAGLRRLTDVISSLEFLNSTGDFVSGSSFFLYGIKNS